MKGKLRALSAVLAVLLFAGALMLPAAGYAGEGNTDKIEGELLALLEASDDPNALFEIEVSTGVVSDAAIDEEMRANHSEEMAAFEFGGTYRATSLMPHVELKKLLGDVDIDRPLQEALFDGLSTCVRAGLLPLTHRILVTIDEAFAYTTADQVEQGIRSGTTLEYLYTVAKYDQFSACRRACIKKLLHQQYAVLYRELEGLTYTVSWEGDSVGWLIMTANEETVRYLTTLHGVGSVFLHEDHVFAD